MTIKTSRAKKAPTKRITRSISFEKQLLDYCARKAARENRTVNWIVNDLVRKDSASPAAAGSTGT